MTRKLIHGVLALTLAACGATEADSLDSLDSLIGAQQAAHRAFSFVLGDDAAAPDDPDLLASLWELRTAMLSGGAKSLPGYLGEVEGLPAVIVPVYGCSSRHPDVADLIDEIGAMLSRETPRADDFFAVDLGVHCESDGSCFRLRGLDPEPGRLTQPLSGVTGATADAVLVTSGVRTTVRTVPATATYFSSNVPVAGAPCSPVPLAEGQETTRFVSGAGNFRKCL